MLKLKSILACLAVPALVVACTQQSPDEPTPLEDPGVFQNQNSLFRTELEEIVLQPEERTEIKAVLEEDKVILFHWSTQGGPVYVDFHGHEPDDDSYWVRYREQEAGTSGSGSLVAPLSGEHGWYFRNDNPNEIVINLRVTGYFSEIIDYGIFDTPEAE